LLRAFRFWDSFEQDSNCKAWLLRILTNTFINEYQRKKRSREVLDAPRPSRKRPTACWSMRGERSAVARARAARAQRE
jgi:RNA polymerase sigma-70 factor (ECF subfamily)